MQTACPICHTIFRVAATTLHESDGMVQCGVCGMVFNAHANWIATTTPQESEPERDVAPVPDPSRVGDETGLNAEPLYSLTTEANVDINTATTDDLSEPVSASNLVQSTVPDPVTTYEFIAETGLSASLAASDTETEMQPELDAGCMDITTDCRAIDKLAIDLLPTDVSASPVNTPTLNAIDFTNKTQQPIVFVVLSSTLLVLLLLQIAYLYRNQIASQYPQSKPAIVDLCRVLGCQLALPHSIDALKLSSSELTTDPKRPSLMHVSFGVENLANTVVAYPSISLALINDAGEIVVKRNFKPQTYAGNAAIDQGIAAHDEISAQLALKIDQINVSNYQILLFYP